MQTEINLKIEGTPAKRTIGRVIKTPTFKIITVPVQALL